VCDARVAERARSAAEESDVEELAASPRSPRHACCSGTCGGNKIEKKKGKKNVAEVDDFGAVATPPRASSPAATYGVAATRMATR
tara:strand:- start:2717 stop:2971 length:255 start_codon:yes stop_codon:yes gene_type:complete